MPDTEEYNATENHAGTAQAQGIRDESRTPINPFLQMSPLEAISTVGSHLVKIGTALEDLSRTINSLIVVMQNREAIETILTQVRALAEAATPPSGSCTTTAHAAPAPPPPPPPPPPAGGQAEQAGIPGTGRPVPDMKDIVSMLSSPAVQNLLSALASQVRRPPGK